MPLGLPITQTSTISTTDCFESPPSPLPPLTTCTVAVIGLGYVGLPLALAFATPGACIRTGSPLKRRVIGFDINHQRLEELHQGLDRTKEASPEELKVARILNSQGP